MGTTNSPIPLSLTERWRDLAACKGHGPADFFPDSPLEPHSSAARISLTTQILAAKRLCAICPVQDHCYQYAISNDIYYGIWGGYAMTRPARKKRAERARAS